MLFIYFYIFRNKSSSEIPLTTDQWNQFFVVDSHGNSLYLEITLPFKANPNISIQPVMDRQVILLTGTQEVVQIAKEHIGKALEKQLSVDKCVQFLYMCVFLGEAWLPRMW